MYFVGSQNRYYEAPNPYDSGMMNVLSGATLFCKITHASNIFMIHIHRDSLGRFVLIFSFNTNLGAHMGHHRFVVLFGRNNEHENTEKGIFFIVLLSLIF